MRHSRMTAASPRTRIDPYGGAHPSRMEVAYGTPRDQPLAVAGEARLLAGHRSHRRAARAVLRRPDLYERRWTATTRRGHGRAVGRSDGQPRGRVESGRIWTEQCRAAELLHDGRARVLRPLQRRHGAARGGWLSAERYAAGCRA